MGKKKRRKRRRISFHFFFLFDDLIKVPLKILWSCSSETETINLSLVELVTTRRHIKYR